MMYDFHDLNINRKIETEPLPAEALNYGGHWLDQEIDGYMTLSTSGRNEFSRQINAADRVDDGAVYLSSRIESKKITVTFQLLASTIEQYNERLKKLKQLLFQPNQPFYFADLQQYHFVGTASALTLDSETLNTTGKIELSLADPYLHGNVKTITGSGTQIKIIDSELIYPQTPDKLTFTPTKAVADLTITCADKKINLPLIGVDAYQTVVIDFANLNLSINAVDSLMSLSLDSNLNDFYISNGSAISINATGSYKLEYEVKQL